ncbi:ATP-binding protein [Oscillatoria salina]|uniref:ATP-binding protein n=1 Tax=Oscillatoria salina TaxID=331517 RepID=UPI001CC93A5B|nr:ATP-binding protein [Oscillatoria salina]
MVELNIAAFGFWQHCASSLLLYQSVLKNEVGQAFLELLDSFGQRNARICRTAYGKWFQALANQNKTWQDYLIERILLDDNPFSRQVQQADISNLPPALVAAAKYDLQALQNLAKCRSQQLTKGVQFIAKLNAGQSLLNFEESLEYSLLAEEYTAELETLGINNFNEQVADLAQNLARIQPIAWDLETNSNSFLHQQKNWADAIPELARYYQEKGTGLFAQYKALRWQQNQLIGIPNPDPIQLEEIVGYEYQKENLLKNTEFLLAGYSALHVLLYGSRGSGKSSLVKALLQKFRDSKLRLIEVAKSELKDLPIIVEKLRNLPQKFIIFVDDLSFEEDDEAFKALKVVLEGNVTARAQNVVVYATSNRRHLVREFFRDRPRPRDNDEVHPWDTVQEKLSFSDRFGLTLTFEPANQDTYLEIVRHLAKLEKIVISNEELEFQAKQWATRHNGRSGRTARQFIDFLQAELGINHR